MIRRMAVRENSVSWHHGSSNEGPTETPPYIRKHYRIEEFYEGPWIVPPLYRKPLGQRKCVCFPRPGKCLGAYLREDFFRGQHAKSGITLREINFWFVWNQLESECIHHFRIDFESNWIPFAVQNQSEKWYMQSVSGWFNANQELISVSVNAQKYFTNLIKSNRYQIVFTIFRLILSQTDVRLVLNQPENG